MYSVNNEQQPKWEKNQVISGLLMAKSNIPAQQWLHV